MDTVFAAIRIDVCSNDVGRQTSGLLVALQLAAGGKDISSLTPIICSEILANNSSPVSKKLAFDVVRITRLTADLWEVVCRGMHADFISASPEVTAVAASFIPALPSWRIGDFLVDNFKEITSGIVSESALLRQATVEALGCLLARDDFVSLCAESATILERGNVWWAQLARSMLDSSDAVSAAAFEAAGHLFREFSSKRLSRLGGDGGMALDEAALAVRGQFVNAACQFVWSRRDLLMARSLLLPMESIRTTVYPLVYAARAVATGLVENMRALGAGGNMAGTNGMDLLTPNEPREEDEAAFLKAERILGVSDIVSHLVPLLTAVDPALVYEVGTHVLSLAGVPGGKPEWASAPITAFLTLWDRQEYAAGREAIVKAVVSNLQLLDVHMQVALFRRLLLMVRNLRMEADRMHALASICRTAVCIDLFVKESARRGQKPLQGTDVSALLEDPKLRAEFASTTCPSLFREELLACLAISCFQLAQPPPPAAAPSAGSNVTAGAVAGVAGADELEWTQPALEVLEVCRACVIWDCAGRTYAQDCYLRLLTRICHLYASKGGPRTVTEGAPPQQVQAQQRLDTLLRNLLDDLPEVASPRMYARVLWVLCEHLPLGNLDPLFADEPRDPLNLLVGGLHRLLFNTSSNATPGAANRLQDVQAALVCAQHLGGRGGFRAACQVVAETEAFRHSQLADAVNQHQCRLILQLLAHVTRFPDRRWAAGGGTTGEYPFSHHKLPVQHNENSSALDRKLELLVLTAVRDLWSPALSELDLVRDPTGASGGKEHQANPPLVVLSGSSDPILVEAIHVTDVKEQRVILNMKLLNVTELDLQRVDVRVGLTGALTFMDAAPQAIRELVNVNSQEAVMADVTAGITQFERCSLCVQMLYHPTGSHVAPVRAIEDDHGQLGISDDSGSGRSEPKRRPGAPNSLPEVILLRCKPYRIPLTDLLLPHEISTVEFFRAVSSLPARCELAAMYEYETNEQTGALRADEMGVRRLLGGLQGIDSKPLHKVCAHLLRSRAGFQLCYMAKTWYGDSLAMVVFGMSDIAPDGGLGEDLTTMLCKFVLCSSSQRVVDEIAAEPQAWLDDLTAGSLRVVTEDQLAAQSVAKQRLMTQQIAFLKKNMKPTTDGIALPGLPPPEEAEAEEVPVIPEEQHALQAAVLQTWSTLRARQLAATAAKAAGS